MWGGVRGLGRWVILIAACQLWLLACKSSSSSGHNAGGGGSSVESSGGTGTGGSGAHTSSGGTGAGGGENVVTQGLLPLTDSRRDGCAEFCRLLGDASCENDSPSYCVGSCQLAARLPDCGAKYDDFFACLPEKTALCGNEGYGYIDGCGQLQGASHQCGEAVLWAPNQFAEECESYCDGLTEVDCGGAPVQAECKEYCIRGGNIPSCQETMGEYLQCHHTATPACVGGRPEYPHCQDKIASYYSCGTRVQEGLHGPAAPPTKPSGLPPLTEELREDCNHLCDLVSKEGVLSQEGKACRSSPHHVCANDCRIAARLKSCQDEYSELFDCAESAKGATCSDESYHFSRVAGCEEEHNAALACRNELFFSGDESDDVCRDDCAMRLEANCQDAPDSVSCFWDCVFNSNLAPGCEAHFQRAKQCQGEQGYVCENDWPVGRARCDHRWQDFWTCRVTVGNN